MPKLCSRLRGTDAEDRMTQGGGDDLGADDGVGDEREAEEPLGLLINADDEVPGLLESEESGDESGEEGRWRK